MSTGHSIFDTLNNASKGGTDKQTPTGHFRTRDLPLEKLYRNERNFYPITEIEDLAGRILAHGLIENLAAVYDPSPAGEYRIISGERRLEAMKLLVQRGYQEFQTVTVNVRAKLSSEEETLELIDANAQRRKTLKVQLDEYRTEKATLEAMRAKGIKLEGFDLDRGRLRDVIAARMNMSATRIAQLERISTGLIPELQGLIDEGRMEVSAAYNLAGINPAAQRDAYERAQEDGGEITNKAAEAMRRAAKPQESGNPWAVGQAAGRCQIENGKCRHGDVIRANFLNEGILEGCAGCCAICMNSETCELVCEAQAAKMAAERARREKKETAQAEAENDAQSAEAATQEEKTQAVEANPETIVSMCYHCAKYGDCIDKTDKTVSCDQYENPAERQQPENGSILTRAARTDEQLLGLVKKNGVIALRNSAYVTPTEASRIESLLSAMWDRWEKTGGWNG